MMIYENLRAVASDFDVFLFDAYGVFWGGNGFYPQSREVMRELVAQGKVVAVVSNSTQMNEDMVATYEKRGLLLGRDCSLMVASGEVLRSDLLAQKLAFKQNANPRKYYVIGKPHQKLFANTIYQQVATPEEADFVYCGVPYVTQEMAEKYPEYRNSLWPVKCNEQGEVVVWDTTTDKYFTDIVNKVVELKLPVLNANPDFMAKEGHNLCPEKPAVFVVRNGSLAEMFRQRGAEVLEYGKPHMNIYEYTFNKLKEAGIRLDKSRTCMIGDTVRTDIKGAVNAQIVPILCVETGVTAQDISEGKSVKSLCENENIDVQQVILIKQVGGK